MKQSHDARHLDASGKQKYNATHQKVSPEERMMSQCKDYINKIGEKLYANGDVKVNNSRKCIGSQFVLPDRRNDVCEEIS